MMSYLKLKTELTKKFLKDDLKKHQPKVNEIHEMIHNKTGLGNDFLGWLTLPVDIQEEMGRISKAAKKIQNQSEVLVVIGIGGSYLGAQAALDYLVNGKESKMEVVFAGHQMSSGYLNRLVSYLENKDFSINVISKSGTTTESAIAFRILKELIYKKYGKDAKDRIFVTTDAKRGALYSASVEEGYERFVIPDDVGGRFSVLSAVGLLPLAAAGYNIKEMVKGAEHAMVRYHNSDLDQNESYQYALTRFLLYKAGYKVETLAFYEYELFYVAEWWKQLYGESEGKGGKGLFPASLNLTTDLHSMGQYMQDGPRFLIETVLSVEKVAKDIKIPYFENDNDNLNYLAGARLSYVNKQAQKGTIEAHYEGGVPIMELEIPELTEYSFGYLVYFFEKACAMSAYLLEVNPFDQPGVEKYKSNMFRLLGKPKK
ncbi:MAG: glucose-6-phosphate isomerase [Acholeplasmataceae bacterium]